MVKPKGKKLAGVRSKHFEFARWSNPKGEAFTLIKYPYQSIQRMYFFRKEFQELIDLLKKAEKEIIDPIKQKEIDDGVKIQRSSVRDKTGKDPISRL